MGRCSSCTEIGRQTEEIKAYAENVISTLEALLRRLENSNLRNQENDESDRNDRADQQSEDYENDKDNDDDKSDKDHVGSDENKSNGAEEEVNSDIFSCPRVECRCRKPDKDFKRYSRHYATHVVCSVSCAGCSKSLHRVSVLKRHHKECEVLKKQQGMPEHQEAMITMKQKVQEAATKASHEARAALRPSKRRNSRDTNDTQPRKKAKPDICANSPIPSSSTVAHGLMTNQDYPPLSYQGQPSTQNTVAIDVETAGPVGRTMHPLAAQQEDRGSTDEAAVQGQYTTAQNLTTGARIIQSLTTNAHETFALPGDQYPMGPHVTTLRSSSFLTNTMDGSYVGDHDSAEQDTSALRGSSFLTNTMDGSYIDDQFPAGPTAMDLGGSGFASNSLDGSFHTHGSLDGMPSNLVTWEPHQFA